MHLESDVHVGLINIRSFLVYYKNLIFHKHYSGSSNDTWISHNFPSLSADSSLCSAVRHSSNHQSNLTIRPASVDKSAVSFFFPLKWAIGKPTDINTWDICGNSVKKDIEFNAFHLVSFVSFKSHRAADL